MSADIRGASDAQAELLREILHGISSTRIQRVTVRPFEPVVEGEESFAGPYGDEVVVTAVPPDFRAQWDADMLGRAYAQRSKETGLTSAAWLTFGESGRTLQGSPGRPAEAPLDAVHLKRFRSDVGAALGTATLETFDVIRPRATAVALAVRVEEPHAFLRYTSYGFLRCLADWRLRCDGIFAEVHDDKPGSILTIGWHPYGGFSSSRPDVSCCAPHLGMSRAIDDPGPPCCPVLGPDSSNE